MSPPYHCLSHSSGYSVSGARNGESHSPHSLFPAQPSRDRDCQGQRPVSGTERLKVPAACSRAEVLCRAGVGGTQPTGCSIQHHPGASKAARQSPWHPHSCPRPPGVVTQRRLQSLLGQRTLMQERGQGECHGRFHVVCETHRS